MNPQLHDEFVALRALYYSGEISDEEWALLQIHMSYCDSCRKTFLEYQKIHADVIPAMAAVVAWDSTEAPAESAASLDAAEQRLMRRLDSASTQETRPEPRRFVGRSSRLLIAVCALAIAGLTGIFFIRARNHSIAQGSGAPPPRYQPAQSVSTTPDSAAQQDLERTQAETAKLRQQLDASANRVRQANRALDRVEQQLDSEQTARGQLNQEKEQLKQQLLAMQAEMESMRTRAVSTGTEATEQANRIALLGSQVHELRASLDEKDVALNEKDRMLALDKDFLAHDRDIRDLIGARNLYIADIFDTTESGKTAKQFGRIFYTKDRSLVFYGFDLDSQAGRKQNVSYQVWGSGSDRPAPVSLGLFYQDDTHKRWVLRCNDAKSLARLDMVFVTVEPPGGSNRPTGKPLLRAYLQIQPNHP
ncbi:anti-sigma factor domain-containing protein [Acidicapsa dinghuensis]|uniref:Anti-sigma factor domain-containing protein n=1 Tax=Acidicapsa dinghuensis TaxID=2218256 RepID=A0ABW1EBX2_9BACT|nr:anti-sigma factor [Acidicapsa dinghuensis]